MSEQKLFKELRGDFSLYYREDEPPTNRGTYTLTAPRWYVSWAAPTFLRDEEDYVVDWQIGDGMHQLLEGILNNSVVKEEVDKKVQWALDRSKENLLDRLYGASLGGKIDMYLVSKIVEEELDGNRNT